jgi:hypothetical protein
MQKDPKDPIYFLLKEQLFNLNNGQFILLPKGQKFLEEVNELVIRSEENPEYKISHNETKSILQNYFWIQ